jgi:PPIC-type PPIASE domain
VKLLREPLLHFLLLGCGLFLLFHVVNAGRKDVPDEIVVTAGTVEHLAATFTRTWQRPPTREELDGLIQAYIRDEVFYREATALGLDRDDVVIRRRLRQKMEFIADEVAAQSEPTDDELRAYFDTHATAYRQPDRFTLRQIYLDPANHGETLQSEAERLLGLLNDGTEVDPAELGDRLMLPSELSAATYGDIAASFGETFATRLRDLPLGRWAGPVPSGYGVHLVRLEERIAGGVPSFEDARDRVRRDLAHERGERALDDLFEKLLRRYTVRVEGVEASSGGVAQVRE